MFFVIVKVYGGICCYSLLFLVLVGIEEKEKDVNLWFYIWGIWRGCKCCVCIFRESFGEMALSVGVV